MSAAYPSRAADRDRWIRALRPPRRAADPRRPYAFLVEPERSASGEALPTAAVFLTNRECPWRCLMCDLWQHTLEQTVPPGAIPEQIDWALRQLPPSRQIKLYNSGSFFDPGAIPPEDHAPIARRLERFERVIVECHPALVNESVLRFRDRLSGRLEVAMGLETAHPHVLEKLNKRMTLEHYRQASEFLARHDIDLRAFILVRPPFMDEVEGLFWAKRSIDFARDCHASVAVLIPTRPGNGAMEALAAHGDYAAPRLISLEEALEYGLSTGGLRVFADLWDLEAFSACPTCFPARLDRLRAMNLTQQATPTVDCDHCGGR